MRLDGEAVCHHMSMPSVPVKVAAYDNKPVETEVLKATNQDGREGTQGMSFSLGVKNYEITDSLPTGKFDKVGPEPEPCEFDNNEENMAGGVNEVKDLTSSYAVTSEKSLPENETALYMDKTVTDVELPKLMACFKQYVIKDICIDEGVPSPKRTLVENFEVGHKRYIHILQSELDEYGVLTKATEANIHPICDDLKTSVSESQLSSNDDKEVAKIGKIDSVQAETGGNVCATDVVNDILYEKVTPEKVHLVLMSESAHHHSVCDASSFVRHEGPEQAAQEHACNGISSLEPRPENGADKATLASTVSPSAHEVTSQDRDHKNSLSTTVTENGIDNNSFDSSPQKNIRVEGVETSQQQQYGRSINASVLEDDPLDSLTGSTRSFFIQHGLEESNNTGIGPVSGPLGSISFRSDSSTTSTRSFAFPILHSEWNSSPVKMAKADRRHLRKHRGWRVAILCCRF